MGIKQLYNDNLRKLPNEYGDVSVMPIRCIADGVTLSKKLLYVCFISYSYRVIVTGEKILITFALAEDRTSDPPHVKQTLYHDAIKAGLYRKAVKLCYIPNTTSYSPPF